MPHRKRRARKRFDHGEPISRIDTRPMAFVAMFLAVVFLFPASTVRQHVLTIDLWGPHGNALYLAPISEREPIYNQIAVTADDRILWNCDPVDLNQLAFLLDYTMTMEFEPGLVFHPEPDASYDLAAKTLRVIRGAGVTKFEFGGLEAHRHFLSDRGQPVGGSLAVGLTLFIPEDAREVDPTTIPGAMPCPLPRPL